MFVDFYRIIFWYHQLVCFDAYRILRGESSCGPVQMCNPVVYLLKQMFEGWMIVATGQSYGKKCDLFSE